MPRISFTQRFSIWLSAFCCLVGATLSAQETIRTWSDDSGSFSTQAVLLDYRASSVVLRKTNGVTITVPLNILSKQDQQYVLFYEAKQIRSESKTHLVRKPVSSLEESTRAKTSPTFSTASFESQPAFAKARSSNAPITPELANLIEAFPADGEPADQIRSLQILSESWPQNRNSEIVELFEKCVGSSQPAIQKLALRTLAFHNAEESFSTILKALEDQNLSVSFTAYDLVGRLKDPRAVNTLVESLGGPRSQHASSSLAKYGPSIQRDITPLLSDPSVSKRQTACVLLRKVGAEDGLLALKRMITNEESLRVRLYASDAIDTIQRRLKMVSLLEK